MGSGTGTGAGSGSSTRAATALYVVGAVLFLGLPWEAAHGFPLDPARSYLSELAALDQPTSATFRWIDGVAGLLVVLASVLVAVRARSMARWARIVPSCLALAGLGIVADVLWPMTCSPSTSSSCAAASHGLNDVLHVIASVVTNACVTVAAFAILWIALRSLDVPPRARAVAVVVVTVLLLVLMGASGVLAACAGDGPMAAPGGLVQRVQVIMFSALLVMVVPALGLPGRAHRL